jgi:hypothetical protein
VAFAAIVEGAQVGETEEIADDIEELPDPLPQAASPSKNESPNAVLTSWLFMKVSAKNPAIFGILWIHCSERG